MSSPSKRIVKRGYLFDRKGLMDRKRWYVLTQDVTGGVCLIEIYKDERAAARNEPAKASINVHDIVKVHRVVERKQSFEVLCPGIGYRFMANSDVEADEWVTSLGGLILYRRDPAALPVTHTQPVAISHTLPTCPLVMDTAPVQRSQSATFHPHTTLPTPPDVATSPTAQHLSHSLSRRYSTELSAPFCSFPPPPSPPSSSSSSSMASGSNASYEQAWSMAPSDVDTDVRFRVQVKESEGLVVSGAADLVLGDGRLALHTPDTDQPLVSWPIAALRRYGVNNVSLTIVTGRNCSTGEGKFQFYTQQSRRAYSHLHAMAVCKAAAKTQSLHRTGSGVSLPHQLGAHGNTQHPTILPLEGGCGQQSVQELVEPEERQFPTHSHSQHSTSTLC